MTPKEKAIELVDKYNLNENLYYSITEYQAKECALIAVDEIIEDNRISYMILGVGINKYYWEEVKKEIEAL